VLRNRRGVAVDPVPFVVTCGSLFLLLYSFAPLYLRALGVGLWTALGVTTVLYGVATVLAYRHQVRRADPKRRSRVPAELRFRWLVYLMLLGAATAVFLALPLVAR